MTETKTFWQKRYTLLLLAFLAFIICYLDRVNISLAAISMQQEFGWSDTTKGYVFSSFFWGYLLMQIGGGYLANRYGGKLVLGSAVVFWSIFTILTPTAAMLSLPALFAVRFLMGVGEAGLAPSSLGIVGRWFPKNEQTRAMGFLSSGAIMGTILALLLGGWIINAYGWPAIFYLFGASGFIWVIFWYFFVTDQPATHPTISAKEVALIEAGGGVTEKAKNIPWRELLTKKQVWALCTAGFASSWTLYIFLSWLPSYFADVHGLNISGAGIYSLFPWISMFLMLNVGGWVGDSMIKKGISLTLTRKLMVGFGLIGGAVMMIFMRDATSPEIATLLMFCALGITAFSFAAIVPNCLDITPKFADILYGTVNTFGTLAGALGAPIAGYILTSTGSYDNVFIVTAAISLVGACIFLFFGSGEKKFQWGEIEYYST